MSYKLFLLFLFFSGAVCHGESIDGTISNSSIETDTTTDSLYDGSVEISDPFIIAAASGDVALVEQFLQNGTSINYAEPVLGLTALVVAIAAGNEVMVNFLLAQIDIDVNKKMNDGLTPLHCAVLQNDPHMVQLLIDSKKIDLSVVEQHGMTAKTIALSSGYTECSKLLEAAT